MYLKSPDPDAYVVVHETGRYPVRGGVFSVPAELRDRFAAFPETDDVDGESAAELARLGVLPLDGEPVAAPAEPEAASEPEAAAESEEGEPAEEHAEDEQAESEPQGEPEVEAEPEPAAETVAEEKPAPKPRKPRKPRSRK